jgi:type IV pilus assembly protein PilW
MELNMTSKRQFNVPTKQSGLSLIEMMIALMLGAIVTVGVIQLFVGSSQTYKMLVGQSRMQESGRFALGFLGRALRSAGYKGCYSTNNDIVNTLALSNNLPYEFDLRTAVRGNNSTSATIWAPALTTLPGKVTGSYTEPVGSDASVTGIDITTIAQGTDVLTTRNLSPNDARLVVPPTNQTGPLIVNMPAAGLGFEIDHFAMASNCENTTIFRVTDVDLNSPSAGRATIGHDIDDTDIFRNTFSKLASLNSFGTTDTQVNAIQTHIFYIAPGSGKNNLKDTPLSLWRKTSLDKPVELVEGVENLQLLFGEDLDNDGIPNWYRPANTISDFTDVITVRVSISVNSVDEVGSNSVDGLLHRTFTETVLLRNQG